MARGVALRLSTAATVMIWFQTAKRLVISVRHSSALINDDGAEVLSDAAERNRNRRACPGEAKAAQRPAALVGARRNVTAT